MIIHMLKEYPEYAETVIDWMNREFGNETSRNFYKGIVDHSMIENALPMTFIALEEDALIGTVSLWRGDLLSRQELTPWLSALIVNPECRNSGIGKVLQDYVISYCKGKKYPTVYLYTDLKNYYEKNDWEYFDTGYEYTGNEVRIYRKQL